jgi:hypothetical protein
LLDKATIMIGPGLLNSGLLGQSPFGSAMAKRGLAAPAAPTGLTATQVNANVELDWTDAVTNETGYRIYRSNDGVTYAEIDDIAADSVAYTDVAPGNGVWYYKVAAYNAAGEAVSDAASVVMYLLRDEFTTDRAAGAVHGTAAEPGPGTRHVQSGGGYPLISGGWIEFGPNVDADGTPGLWYPPDTVGMTPVQGITVLGRIKGDGINPIWGNLGFDVDRGSHLSSMAVSIENNIVAGQSSTRIFSTLDPTEVVDIAVVAGGSTSTPYLSFIRSTTTYPEWTLLFMASNAAYTALWAGTCKNGDTYIEKHLCKTIRIPSVYFMPAPSVSDGFGLGGFGVTDGLGHGIPSGTGAGGDGVVWTARAGTWGIQNNRARATALAGGIAIATVPGNTPNPIVRAGNIFKGAGAIYGYIGLVVRYKDNSNYARVTIGTPTQLFKLATPDYEFSTGAELVIHLNSAALQAFYNGKTPVGASANLTLIGNDTDEVGLIATSTSTSDTIDKFTVRPRGNEGQYAYLDEYLPS